MSKISVFVWLLVAAIGCASFAPPSVQQRAEAIHERTADMDAAANKIVLVSGTTITGHDTYTTLGPVKGYCEQSPEGNQQTVEGDNIRQAAVRKYGDRADAIVKYSSAYVDMGAGAGYWECMGDAVSFSSAATAAPMQ